MHTASLRSPRPVTVLGTVMGVRRDGAGYVHRVDATGPDGRRVSFDVVTNQHHTGSVTVRWDPTGVVAPRFVSTRPWGLYAVAVLVIVALAVGGWLLLG